MKTLVFGITGTTGSGKTTVSEVFQRLGVTVIDADKVYHSLIKKGEPCLMEICSFFGDDILTADGELDRKALAKIVFKNNQYLEKLNSITHKYIKEAIEELIADSGIYAIDAAVLLGSPVADLCKYTITVTADSSVRKKRIIMRDSLTEAEAQMRIDSQPADDFYIENTDFVIYNDGRYDLEEEAKKILSQMLL